MNIKSKIIALVVAAVAVLGGVTFAFRDEFFSNKSLYLKIEKENIKMLSEKLEEIKEEDMLGMFFDDGSNKSVQKTDLSLNIKADGFAKDIANFVNSLKVTVTDEIIQKDDYKNKEIKLSYGENELIAANIVNDDETVGVSIPKLYDKWIVTDMSLAEVISKIIKSDEATGTTNTMTLPEVKAVFDLSKTEKKDLQNNVKYYTDLFLKTLENVEFVDTLDNTFNYDEKEVISDSMSLQLSEVEALARATQMLDKVKESGQLLDFVYNKVSDVKQAHGENNILTDKIPEKKVVLDKINTLLEAIDARLVELGVTDVEILFDEENNYLGAEGISNDKYVMTIFYDNDYRILKREIGILKYSTEDEVTTFVSKCEFVTVDDEDESYYMFKRPDEIIIDKVQKNGGVSTHNILKSYYRESFSFEGFKFNKTQKWYENEKVVTIEVDSSNENQKIISVELPNIKGFRFFIDISRDELGRNELNVVTKVGLDIKGEKQYATFTKNIVRKADVSKLDINSNSININEKTQEKIEMISDVIKGNTAGLSDAIKEKTGIDLTNLLEKVKDVPQKAIDTYKSLNSLGIIG